MFSSPIYAGLFLMACFCTPPLIGIALLSNLHTALYRLYTNIILFIIGKIAFITDHKIPPLPKETCSASGIETPTGIRGYHGCAKCREANNNEVSAHT